MAKPAASGKKAKQRHQDNCERENREGNRQLQSQWANCCRAGQRISELETKLAELQLKEGPLAQKAKQVMPVRKALLDQKGKRRGWPAGPPGLKGEKGDPGPKGEKKAILGRKARLAKR
jgi:hypothetical protein